MENSKQIAFSLKEFGYFSANYQRSREINKFRLKVKRKLAALGKLLLPALHNAGLDLKMRTSLHHPYIHNRFSVQSLWAYFSAPAPSRHDLVQRLGKELGEDLHLHYNNTLLLLGIEQERLLISLKVHPAAWWDGQNIKNKCNRQQSGVLLKLLNNLDGFSLKLDSWPNLHCCSLLTASDLQRFFDYYVPGEHWFHLDYYLEKNQPIATSEQFVDFAREKLLELIPVYRFIVWQPDNNYVPQLFTSK